MIHKSFDLRLFPGPNQPRKRCSRQAEKMGKKAAVDYRVVSGLTELGPDTKQRASWAKAPLISGLCAARLKSCPDKKPASLVD